MLAGILLTSALIPGTALKTQAAAHNIKDVQSQITSDVVVQDAIPSGAMTNCFTFQYNGHDYFAGAVRGGVYIVYDIDAKRQVYKGQSNIGTVRGFCLDGYGNLWIYGASYTLHKLNMATGEEKAVKISNGGTGITSFNVLGLTWDPVTKKLYCGTYNKGSILMIDPQTGKNECISGVLDGTPDDGLAPDYMYAGFAGLVIQDGYIYLGADGDTNADGVTSHHIVKFSIKDRKAVDYIDLVKSGHWGTSGHFMLYKKLLGDVILFDRDATVGKTVAVDISGEKMKLVDMGADMPRGFTGYVSDPINGKAYCCSSSGGLVEIDVSTMKATKMSTADFPTSMIKLYAGGSCIATVEGDDRLPGTSLVTFVAHEATQTVDLVFHNVQSKRTVVWNDALTNVGAGNRLTPITASPDGKTIYVGAYGNNQLGIYDLTTGKTTYWATADHQIDGLIWYNGKIYSGNYQSACLNEINPTTGTVKTFFSLQKTFGMARVHALAAGDNKVFCGMVPDKYKLGGVLAWYDLNTKLTYVVTGPNKEDVYYADTSGSSAVWRSAATGKTVTLSVDNADATGLIKNQTIVSITYKDGYIYGTTCIGGGSGATADPSTSAVIFVYDVKNMKLAGTLDLRQKFSGYPSTVEAVHVVAADPDIRGKFWAVTAGTLVSFTFDATKGSFNVKEEVSVNKNKYDSGSQWHPSAILFEGSYMYVSLQGYGVCMLRRNNPQEGYLLAPSTGNYEFVLGADGNLYYHNDYDIVRLNTAKFVASVKGNDEPFNPSEPADGGIPAGDGDGALEGKPVGWIILLCVVIAGTVAVTLVFRRKKD